MNPNARGIFLRGAKFIHKDTGNGTFALYAEGTLELLGIPGVTLAAQQVTISYNTGTADAVIDIAGFLTKTVAPGELAVTRHARSSRSAAWSSSGAFTFKTGATKGDLEIGLTAGRLVLGDVLEVDTITGTLHSTATGVAASIGGRIKLTVAGHRLPLTVDNISVTDRHGRQARSSSRSRSTSSCSGRRSRARSGSSKSRAGRRWRDAGEAHQVARHQRAPVHRRRGRRARASSSPSGTALFVIRPTGLAGRVEGTVAVKIPGDPVKFSGTFARRGQHHRRRRLRAVLGGRPSLALPAGPYLRVTGDNLELTFAGQRITGSFVFESATTSAGKVVRVLVTNVSAAFGDGTTNFVTLSGGSGFFVISPAGMAGDIGGTVAVNIPGVTLSGTLRLVAEHVDHARRRHVDAVRPARRRRATRSRSATSTATAAWTWSSGTAGDGLVLHLGDGSGDPYDGLAGDRVRPHGRDDHRDRARRRRQRRRPRRGRRPPRARSTGTRTTAAARFDAGTLIAGVTDARVRARRPQRRRQARPRHGRQVVQRQRRRRLHRRGHGRLRHGRRDRRRRHRRRRQARRRRQRRGSRHHRLPQPRGHGRAHRAASRPPPAPPRSPWPTPTATARCDIIVGNARHSGLWTPATVPPGTPEADIPPPTFSFVAKGTIAAITTATLTGLAFADVDGDGRVDLVTAHGTAATRVQLGTGTLAFAAGATLGSVALKVDKGPYLKVTGTAITLDIAGQKLIGTLQLRALRAARPPRRVRHDALAGRRRARAQPQRRAADRRRRSRRQAHRGDAGRPEPRPGDAERHVQARDQHGHHGGRAVRRRSPPGGPLRPCRGPRRHAHHRRRRAGRQRRGGADDVQHGRQAAHRRVHRPDGQVRHGHGPQRRRAARC